MSRLSQRTLHDPDPNELAVALHRRRAAGLPVCDLTGSNPTHTDLPYDAARVLNALADRRSMRYDADALGLPSARRAVEDLERESGFSIPMDRILLTASTSEAYSFLFKILCDPGDEVAIPRPSYPLFEHLARLESVQAIDYLLAYDGAWHIDFDSLARSLTRKTRAIVVVNPNNPTGSFLKQDELSRLVAFGLPIISDEVFSSFALTGDARRVRSVLETDEVLVFALGGLSKLAALPQLKLAWTCARGPERELRDAFRRLELVADTFLSPSTPVQVALPEILAARAPVELALMARIRKNLTLLEGALLGTALSLLFLEGGWFATVRLPAVLSESEWVLLLLTEDSVSSQPGWFYDFLTGPMIVLSLITDEAEFERGVGLLVSRVALVLA